MADTPENPPHQNEEPSDGPSIQRIEKQAAPLNEPRAGKREPPRREAPGWRRWLNEKLIGI